MTKQFYKLLFIILIFLTKNICAQDSIPKLTGTVKISIKEGTMECNLTLENIPRISDYFIRLNHGMNVLNFKNVGKNEFLIQASYEFDKDSFSTGETMAYFFSDNKGKGKFLPENLQIKYVGKFPVVKDTLNDNYERSDWKGNIAFNGYSLRTDGLQCGWYPVLYDIKKNKSYEDLKYDLDITCEDCKVLFVNGNAPKETTRHRFVNNDPAPINLYCGDYSFTNIDSIYFLNPDLTPEQLKEIGTSLVKYKNYYKQIFGLPYEKAFTLIHTTPLSKRNAWSFMSFPSIVNIGYGKYGLINYLDSSRRSGLAHELAHSYFGSYRKFNDVLGDMMLEGFAEYSSMLVTKKLISQKIYKDDVQYKLKALSKFKAMPFERVKTREDYHNRELYVYYYAPIIFSAIEQKIGEEKMHKWMRNILTNNASYTNYDFLANTLRNVVGEKVFNDIESQYFNSDASIENSEKTLIDL